MKRLFFLSLIALPLFLGTISVTAPSELRAETVAFAKNYAKMSAAKLRAEIKATKKNIKLYRKKAARAAAHNLTLAAKYLLKANKLEALLPLLQHYLDEATRYGQCPPKRSSLIVYIDNDSTHELAVLRSSGLKSESFGIISSGETKRISGKMSDLEEEKGLYGAKFRLTAMINGQEVKWEKTIYREAWSKKKKPCVFKSRWRVTNQDFPAPKLYYSVYAIDLQYNTSNVMYVGTETHLKTLRKCDFKGGGNNCSASYTYAAVSPIFSSLEDAQKDLCKGIAKKTPWNGGVCSRRFLFRNGKTYWGCEPSVNSAVNAYCPKFNQGGTVIGDIVK